ncbi:MULTISPECIES: hypothetical protein [unclassified Bradyrhizobium]|uniref:hypothetical protein n=1 Tax=Bradyrhizobium sp. 31Argb TaxID=3141247 RepID=UPI001A91BA27
MASGRPANLLWGDMKQPFGASLGLIDVTTNVDAVELERAAKRPLMSGFHAQFSIGECAGSAAMTALAGCTLGLFHQP